MKNKRIAILESRFETSMADLVQRSGGIPLSAPAIAEVPDLDQAALAGQINAWLADPPAIVIFQTGVGVKALLKATDALGRTDDLLALLDRSLVIVRGAKPGGPLRARGIRIDRAADEPYTTREVIQTLQDLNLAGQHVLVQRFGEKNLPLEAALLQKGARVSEIPIYRYGLPADTRPLQILLDSLAKRCLDAVVFTSASQVSNLLLFADQQHCRDRIINDLQHTLVVSIGPVCSRMLRQQGIAVDVEANPPKLGPLIQALESAWSAST